MGKWRLDNLCPTTGKRSYRTQHGAMIGNITRPITLYAYQCPHCRNWHLTSRPQ
jgi:hypothetical protein